MRQRTTDERLQKNTERGPIAPLPFLNEVGRISGGNLFSPLPHSPLYLTAVPKEPLGLCRLVVVSRSRAGEYSGCSFRMG